ncbi:MFP subunit of RND family efflux transporter [Candidatus Cyrtobacter comes]|uniref:MFP subunit of RND family efflux transporter n=1 Tax=Candidatus Cyrtobacter comes TaxID=675776 RepID=A0ABU5L772_9RICK|nr:efflux RND transporter periplasmic adaptor subunit [Candidatus Cyrtobacter comes]MDZ5761982.1 MFP subunit of RND family efflux transporter [Candidatus Cyrtobacter comes]
MIIIVFRKGNIDIKKEAEVVQYYHFLDSIPQEREIYINAFGRVRAKNKFPIVSMVNGKIVSLPAKKGIKLEQNYVIMQIDERERKELLESARAKLDNAKILALSAKTLYEGGYGSEADLLKAQSQMIGAEADFKKLKIDLDNCKIKIPYEGYIDELFVSIGQDVIAGQKLVEFVSLNELIIDAVIPENKIHMVKMGTGVLVKFENKEKLAGKVISKSSIIDEKTSSFPIEISISENNIIVGQVANLSISLGKMALHKLPQSALCLNEIGEIGVKVINDDVVGFKRVKIIDEDQDSVFIAGLDSNQERVITIGHEYAKVGHNIPLS